MKSRNWWQKERWLLHGSIIFYCLAYTGQTHVPTREYERDELKNAGLGDKNALLDIDSSQEEFQSHILDLFPRLKDAGGYRFLKGNLFIHIIFQFTLIFRNC